MRTFPASFSPLFPDVAYFVRLVCSSVSISDNFAVFVSALILFIVLIINNL